MRVGIHAAALPDGPSGARARIAGLGAALLEMSDDLEIVLLVAAEAEEPPLEAGDRVRHVRLPYGPGRPLRRLVRGGALRRVTRDLDVLLVDYHPALVRPPTVVTIHDLRALRGLGPRWRRMAFRFVLGGTLRRAAAVVVPSNTVGQEVATRWALPDGKVHVVPNAPDADLSPDGRAETRDEPFVLHVGPDEPRKNLDAVRLSPVPVVLAGRATREDPPFVPLGQVSRDRMVRLLRGARALVLPSRCEGFGLPALEAMACGTPVLAADAGALPEVTAGAATLLSPDDPEAWRRAIADLVDENRRRSMREAGLARTARLGWDAAAEALLGVLYSVSS